MKKFIEDNTQNMLNDLADLVKFESVNCDDEKPFGSENRKVLDAALSKMNNMGFKTENADYYAGYGEIGEGEQVIGLIAHLDVVPAGDGWDSDPFAMVEKDGYVYGRGVSDDKGAAVASMYAMKYLKDTNYPLKKRVRLILGCNEETGSECIRYYVNKYGSVDMGFTPDADFPGIYAEKAIIGGALIGKNSKIIDIKGGAASNIICKEIYCEVPNDSFDEGKFKSYLDDANIKYNIEKSETTKLTVYGKAGHASTPNDGINAINYLMEALYAADFDDSFTNFFHKYFALNLHGEGIGFEAIKDEESNTSTSLGVAKKENGEIIISVDMRAPVKSSVAKCKELIEKIKDENNEYRFFNGVEPIYFDKNSPMIRALIKAYQDVTGDTESKMEAIGGGTYAKTMDNIIAFGCEFHGENNNIHGANESLNIENFKKQVEVYVEAIKNLNEV